MLRGYLLVLTCTPTSKIEMFDFPSQLLMLGIGLHLLFPPPVFPFLTTSLPVPVLKHRQLGQWLPVQGLHAQGAQHA